MVVLAALPFSLSRNDTTQYVKHANERCREVTNMQQSRRLNNNRKNGVCQLT